ncbi:Dipeptidyl peptidase 2 [Fasciola hepatica]|uniref:Dipeptidyl peptidase 2 n=1 Tax=Fasciola hepatica TaxID=6192 RepID=A0A4E0RRJ1_FASHE|nr:Dipeptidyl peptidase 2 [Fasciola hepatica]
MQTVIMIKSGLSAAMNVVAFILLCTAVTYSADGTSVPWPPKESYSNQSVDHFSFGPDNSKFKLRFLYEDLRQNGVGPIFFYCGNEGPIEAFWNNTGFMFDLATSMHALVIFAEHRYYGKSMPFPDSLSQPYIQYLSMEQALADYAYLIVELKQRFNAVRSPVIVFGGSYGGMLAAYMRLRYPHLVAGALAASAPMYWVSGLRRFHRFFEAVTRDYYWTNPECVVKFKDAYSAMDRLVNEGKDGLQLLSKQLRLCRPMANQSDYLWMLKWSRNAFVMMAMMDYPSKASFMGDLPAYPVNVSCDRALSMTDSIDGLREAIGVFYNSSETDTCFDYKLQYIECADITGCGLGDSSLAWDFQSCMEMNLHDASGSTKCDMFPSLPLTPEQVTNYCQQRWGVTPAFDRLATTFGPEAWKSTSNIIFSNGDLDPWAEGGIMTDISDSVVALKIHGGAHHLDLRSPDPTDPPSVREVRETERRLIQYWIRKASN